MGVQRAAVVRAAGGGTFPRGYRGVLVFCGVVLSLLLAACGASTAQVPSSPGGTYKNTEFQFTVTYPAGWVSNEIHTPLGSPQATSSATLAIPLTVVITQTDTQEIDSALLSSFTVTVLNASNAAIASTIKAQQAQASGANPTLKTIPLAKQSAWQSPSVSQQLPDSDQSATHTDYYLLHGKYEFQISTDLIQGGGADADLAAILKSFAFTA